MGNRVAYLGDGLYVEDRGYDLRVYASNGITVYNEVFLDREMLARLNSFANAPVVAEADSSPEGAS